MKKLFLITFLAVFMLSCTDKKYDFENMSEDVHLFDNGVYFPLLTTDVPFSRMIEGYEDNIGLQADGIYFIHSNPGNVDIKEEIYTTGDVLTDQSEISFSGIPDFLCDDNVNLNLANPAFLARIENNGNVYPFWADIALTPLYNDGTRGQKINIQRINFEDAGIMNIYIAKETGNIEIKHDHHARLYIRGTFDYSFFAGIDSAINLGFYVGYDFGSYWAQTSEYLNVVKDETFGNVDIGIQLGYRYGLKF